MIKIRYLKIFLAKKRSPDLLQASSKSVYEMRELGYQLSPLIDGLLLPLISNSRHLSQSRRNVIMNHFQSDYFSVFLTN